MVSLLGIVLSMLLIVVLAFKKVPLYVYAPLCAAIAATFSHLNPYDTLASVFTGGLGSYVSQNFMLFLSSAIFAEFMCKSGASKYIALRLSALAKRSQNSQFAGMMYMALVQIVLTAGGVNDFVVIFLLVGGV